MNKVYVKVSDPRLAASLVVLCQQTPRYRGGSGCGFLNEGSHEPFESHVKYFTTHGIHSLVYENHVLMYCKTEEETNQYCNSHKLLTLDEFLLFVANDFQFPEKPIMIGSRVVKFTPTGIQVGCTFVDKETVYQINEKLQKS